MKFDNPYYEEPKESQKPSPTGQNQNGTTDVKPTQKPDASSGSSNSGNSSNTGTNGGSNTTSGTNGGSSNSQGETGNTSSIPDGAFTPDGTGTVLDTTTGEGDDKQFYTITTEAGNVFYLIIDGKRDDNNVYFLNGVTAVSYTHLDVYKRQGRKSFILPGRTCRKPDFPQRILLRPPACRSRMTERPSGWPTIPGPVSYTHLDVYKRQEYIDENVYVMSLIIRILIILINY